MSFPKTNPYLMLDDEVSSNDESEDEVSSEASEEDSEESDVEAVSDFLQFDHEEVENLDRDAMCEKIDYKNFLKLSIGLLTKNVYHLIYQLMSSCFGTKEDCEKMAELIDNLKRSDDDEDKFFYKSEINKLTKEHMCARNDTVVNDDYLFSKRFDERLNWFKACQETLRKCKYAKWNELEENDDLDNWDIIACLSIIIHAKAINPKGEYIFKLFINKCNEENAEYSFISLSKQIKCIGSPDHLQGAEFDENVETILSFLFDLKRWYKDKACCKLEDCQASREAHNAWMEIKRYYDDFLHEKSTHLQDVYVQLKELNDSTSFYILITAPLPENLARINLECLSNVPWCCAINYDPYLKPKLFMNKEMQTVKFCSASKLASLHIDFFEFLISKETENAAEKVFDFLKSCLESVIGDIKSKNKHIHIVMLCYGKFAVNDSNYSLSSFHENLKILHSYLVELGSKVTEGYSVLFYTDRVSPLKGISPCFHLPLVEFCNHLYGENCGVFKDNKPIILPSHKGNILVEEYSISSIIEDFEIVHKYIDKAELKSLQNAMMNQADISQQEIDQSIIEDLTVHYLRGGCISWVGLSEPYRLDIKREFAEEIKRELKSLKSFPTVFQLFHQAGAGASTLARRVLYDLRDKFICLVLWEDYKYSGKTIHHVKQLYDKLKCSILLLVDEESPQYNTKQLFAEIQSNLISCILFKVIRVPFSHEESNKCSFPYLLTRHLSNNEEVLLKEKYSCYLDAKLMNDRKVYIYNAQTYQLVGKSIIASKVRFNPCQAKHSKYGTITDQLDQHALRVKWSDVEEKCSIYDIQVINQNETQCFMFSGIFYLLHDFRNKLGEYVSLKLDGPSKSFPGKVKFLAYISLLFIYYPNRKDLQHFFDECKDIRSQIPEEAYDFFFIDSNQHFRFVHTLIAKNVLDFYLRNSGINPSQFVIDFLKEYMIYSKLIHTLLWERQMVVAQKRVIKQPFSHLIESLATDFGEDIDVEKIFHQISKLFDDFNSLRNLARYCSIKQKFPEAQKKMEAALRITEAENKALTDLELGRSYTQFGDIYRHELHRQKDTDDCISHEEGKELYKKAIEMYAKAKNYIPALQDQEYLIYGEIKVRLDYLLFIKKVSKLPRKDFSKYLDTDKFAKEMVKACDDLFCLLDNTLLHENDEVCTADIIKAQTKFYNLVGEEIAVKLINKCEKLLEKPDCEVAVKRRYIVMHLANGQFSNKKGHKLLEYLKFLFDKEGYKTDYVLQWLTCVCSFYSRHSNIKDVLLVLKRWGEHVQYADSFVLLYFYACYFIAILQCKATERAKFGRYMENYNNKLIECREKSYSSQPKMLWLLWDEKEACKLSKEKPKSSCLQCFQGEVTDKFPESPVILFSKFYNEFQYPLYMLPSNIPSDVEVNDTVNFSVEFTFKGIKPINITLKRKGQFSTNREKLQAASITKQVDVASVLPTMQQVFLIPVEPSEAIQCSGKYGGSFLWKGHGFMLIIPPDCADQVVNISIKVYLPVSTQGSSIVSPVFDVTTNIEKFKKPLTIRFPHWVNIISEEDKEKLSFLISDTNSSEAKFVKGCFEIGGSFGSIQVDHFCIFCACLGNLSPSFTYLTSAISHYGSHYITSTQSPTISTQPNLTSPTQSPTISAPSNLTSPTQSPTISTPSYLASLTQSPTISTPSNLNLNRQTNLSYNGNIMKRYLDLLILPKCHNELDEWKGIYFIALDCHSYIRDVIRTFKDEKLLPTWVGHSYQVLWRRVVFLPHADEAELYVSTGNYIVITNQKISKQSINTFGLQSIQQNNMTIGSKSNFLPWCGLIVTEKLSSSSRLSVKGLRANGESSEFSLALPKEHNFEEYNIESSCIQTEPTMKWMHKIIIPDISYCWKKVADFLEYPLVKKREIEEKMHHDPYKCCTELMEDWLTSNRGPAPKTWETLVSVLKEIQGLSTSSIEQSLLKEGLISTGESIGVPVN